MLLKKAPQNIVQQLARVDGLQVESGFAARLEAQHAITEKSERAIAVGAQTTGTVNVFGTEMTLQHPLQIGIRNLAIVRTEPITVARLLNLDAFPRGRRNVPFSLCHR